MIAGGSALLLSLVFRPAGQVIGWIARLLVPATRPYDDDLFPQALKEIDPISGSRYTGVIRGGEQKHAGCSHTVAFQFGASFTLATQGVVQRAVLALSPVGSCAVQEAIPSGFNTDAGSQNCQGAFRTANHGCCRLSGGQCL